MSKTIPEISVIVAVYNTEKYLKQCVDSILSQTYKNFELILVNDGSTDSSVKICDHYAKKDERIKVLHQKNSGQTVARQAGFLKSSGKYCLVFDSDDWLEPTALEQMHKAITENNADMVMFDGYFNYDERSITVRQSINSGLYDEKRLLKELYPTMLYSGRFYYFSVYAAMWNKLFKRGLLQKHLLNVKPDIRIGEDGLTSFSSLLDSKVVYVMENALLYHYRDNNISITRSYYKEQINNALSLYDAYNELNHKLKNKYDLSEQIDYYLLYNLKSIVIEEFFYRHKKSLIKRLLYIRSILNNNTVKNVLSKYYKKGMKFEHLALFSAMRIGSTFFTTCIALLIAYKMRLRLIIKRTKVS
jgi:glycosyltransferase involved in cell wall biosynthesis